MHSLPKTVQEAALILDTEIPGWYRRINVQSLNLESGCYCILGQIFNSHNFYSLLIVNPFMIGMDKLFGVRNFGDLPKHPFDQNASKQEWVDEISCRLAAQVEEEELSYAE